MMQWAWELAKRTARECSEDDCLHMAAGIAYYAMFSLFPLLLGLIAILGLLLEPVEAKERLLEMSAQVFPNSADVVTRNVEAVMASRGAMGIFSVIGLLWSATAIFAAIRRSVNRAWDVQRERPFLKQKLLELGMIAGVGLIFLVSAATTAVLRLLWLLLPTQVQQVDSTFIWSLVGSVLPLAFSFGMFALIYRFVPNTTVRWRDVWPGALLAAVLYELAKNVFAWYLASFANYSLVYGSLGAIIVFLLWAYISAFILLLGAEFASEYSRLLGTQKKSGAPRAVRTEI